MNEVVEKSGHQDLPCRVRSDALFSWRGMTDLAKRSRLAMRVADALGRGRGRWRMLDHARKTPPPARLTPDLSRWQNHTLAAVWIGHATLLLRIGGKTILTDPVFANTIGIGLGLMTGGPRRHQLPALTIKQLPPLDLILLSHAHFDHLDRPTLAMLPKSTPVVASNGLRDLIEDLGYRDITELRWGQSTRAGDVQITAHPVNHWGARTFYDNHRGYGAFVLETTSHRILYGADTAYHELWKDMPPVDLAIMGIGAYDPFIRAHTTPEQAWQMARHVQATHVLPIHHSTFRLSREPMTEPIERILVAAGTEMDRVVVREVGGMWTID